MNEKTTDEDSTKPIQRPAFLASFADFKEHIEGQFGDEEKSIDKGRQFAKFAQRLSPLIDEFRDFGQLEINPKESHDGGVDLTAASEAGGGVLAVQSKYRIRSKDELDSILSKFQNYSTARHNTQKNRNLELFPESDQEQHTFAIITATKIEAIRSSYEASSLSSRNFYNQILSEKRLVIVDGSRIFRLIQESYDKDYHIPNRITLESPYQWLNHGDVWVGIVPGTKIVALYREYGAGLFFENIRDFLGEKSGKLAPDRLTVNEQIRETIRTDALKFLARNNGITFKAKRVLQDGESILNLTEGSIVNGCQTTMSLVGSDRNAGECFVLVKVVQSVDAWDIAKSANNQNRIDQIEIELAQYIRPQLVREGSIARGFAYGSAPEPNAAELLGVFYDRQVRYDEIKLLFVGIFSKSPINVSKVNYTFLRFNIIDYLMGVPDTRTEVLDTLFALAASSQSANEKLKCTFENKDFAKPFERVFRGDKSPKYRVFITVLSICAVLEIDISAQTDDSQTGALVLLRFLREARSLVETDEPRFVRAYVLAFTNLMQEGREFSDDAKIRQHFHKHIEISFSQSYENLRSAIAATEAIYGA